jgi:hypothetical protein
MDSKHTPGPYRVYAHPRLGAVRVLDVAGALVADTFTNLRPQSECEANARLIAAAPDLLEALVTLLECTEWIDDAGPDGETYQSPELKKAISDAKAAIGKAEGTTHGT